MKKLPFIGRESEQLQFKQILKAAKGIADTNDLFTNAILIYGVGGMGKSSLCRKFLEIAKTEFPEMTKAYIDWGSKTGYTYTPSELLDTIYNELKVHYNKELELYLKAKKDIKSIRDEIDKILEKEKGMIDMAQPIATTIATTATSNPIVGAAVSGGFNLLGKILGNAEESRLKSKWGIKDERLLFYKNPETCLANCLIEGIDKITEKGKHKILLMLDTCEIIKHSEQWLMNHFLVPILNKNKNVLLVYSSRDNTYNQRNITINEQTILVKGFADKLTASSPLGIDMKLFSEVDIRKYLDQRLNKELNEKAVQFIQKLSRGVPFAVDLLANAIETIGFDSFLKNFEDEKFRLSIEISTSNEQVIKNVAERFLFYCLQSENGKADLPKIYSIAILREKNPEILKELWHVSDPSVTLQSLQGKYSFFTGEAKLHDAVQEFIEEYILSNETLKDGIIKEIGTKALPIYQSIYEKECDKELHLGHRFEEPRWRKATYNLLNCLSWSDPDLASDFFIKRGIELLLFKPDFATELKKPINKLLENELLSNRIRKQVITFSEALSSFRWYSFSEKLFAFCQVAYNEWHLDPIHKSILQIIIGRMQYHQKDFENALNSLLIKCNENSIEKALKEKLAETLDDIGRKYCIDKNDFFIFSDKALKIFEKVFILNENTKSSYRLNRLAEMLRLSDRTVEAIKYFKKAIELSPKDGYYYDMIGSAYEDLALYSEAISSYNKAIELDTKGEKSYWRLAFMHLELNEFDKAIEVCEKVLTINSENAWTYMILSMAYIGKENKDKAIELIETSHSKKIDWLGQFNNNIGYCYEEIGDIDKAIEFYKKGIENGSQNAYTGVGQIYLTLGNITEAEKYLLSATEKQKDNSNPITSLAILNTLKSEYERANSLFEKVIVCAIKKPTITNQFNHVIALVGLKKYEEANKLLKLLSSKFIISHLTIKSLVKDLELLSKAQNSSDEVKVFLSESKKILDDAKRKTNA